MLQISFDILGRSSEYVHHYKVNGWANDNTVSSQIAHYNSTTIHSHLFVGRTILRMGWQCERHHWNYHGNWSWNVEQHYVRQSSSSWCHTGWYRMQYDNYSGLAQLFQTVRLKNSDKNAILFTDSNVLKHIWFSSLFYYFPQESMCSCIQLYIGTNESIGLGNVSSACAEILTHLS